MQEQFHLHTLSNSLDFFNEMCQDLQRACRLPGILAC